MHDEAAAANVLHVCETLKCFIVPLRTEAGDQIFVNKYLLPIVMLPVPQHFLLGSTG